MTSFVLFAVHPPMTVLVHQLACQAKYPDLVMDVRGMGGFCAVDAGDAETRDRIITEMRGKGGLS